MTIRQPKPTQIRLPFTVPKPKKSADPPARVCGLCRKKDSRYTCPRCNIPYCSLACFRDPAHTQCSEPFYHETVKDAVATDPAGGERRNMMEMLRRFEEGDDVEDELVAALEGVDLDEIDSNALFHLLPQEDRDAFLAALKDPDSAAAKELLQSAVESGNGDGPSVLPWWERDIEGEGYAEPPEEIHVDITPPEGVGLKLRYNLVAACLAYIHVCLSLRLPSLSNPPEEAKTELSLLLPFLADRSTTRYDSVSQAWGEVWDKVEGSPSDLGRLLRIVADLIHPPITTDPPKVVLVLADVYRLFAKAGPVAKKIAFYLAAVKQLTRADWLALEAEVKKELEVDE